MELDSGSWEYDLLFNKNQKTIDQTLRGNILLRYQSLSKIIKEVIEDVYKSLNIEFDLKLLGEDFVIPESHPIFKRVFCINHEEVVITGVFGARIRDYNKEDEVYVMTNESDFVFNIKTSEVIKVIDKPVLMIHR